MKFQIVVCISVLLCSCFGSGRESQRQNERITQLEEKMDSLINANNPGVSSLKQQNSLGEASYTTVEQVSRCKGRTKKGFECKRTAKAGGYCWQHGK